jgi:Kef-type K+ transport system membrane component KefB
VAPYRKPTVPPRSNDHYPKTQDRLDFIAQFGSIVLTFLAGMEVDLAYMRRRLGASLGVGVVSWRQGNQ